MKDLTARPLSWLTSRGAESATNFALHSGGGEVRIHGTDGKIRDTNTIGKADPGRTKG
jgi:hypothetical protein